GNLPALLADQRRGPPVDDRFHRPGAHPARQQPVPRGGGSAALDVTEDDHPGRLAEASVDGRGEFEGASGPGTLRHHHDGRALTASLAVLDALYEFFRFDRHFG